MTDISTASDRIDLDNPEFRTVLTLISDTNRSIFLTGKAGTGKSTFLRYLTANCPKKYVVLAPTGIAAVNVGGQTLHSFFKLPFKPLMPDDPEFSSDRRLKARMKYSRRTVKLLKEIELIIIDEISMVRADTIDFIDRLLRSYTGNKRQPFGGKQLLLVGDVFQLEPVVTADMREILKRCYKAPYFFNAMAFDQVSLLSVELTKVYRQRESDFVAMLDRIRMGSPTAEDMRRINSRVMKRADEVYDEAEMRMTIATRREMVDHINQSRLDALKTPERVYVGKVSGDFPENAYPTDIELTLKEGAQIVFVKNDPEHRWVNGTIGRVAEATDDEISVELENGERHSLDLERWDNVRYRYDEKTHKVSEEVLGSFIQFPVKLAWALTIHKSQGLTFRNVTIDVGRGAFTGGQSYVALSRCTSLEGIKLLSTINERDIFVSPVIQRFSRQFNDRRKIDDAIASARADGDYRAALEFVDKGDFRRAVAPFCEAVTLRNELHRPEIVRLISRKLGAIDELKHTIEELKAEMATYRLRLRQLSDEYVEMGDDCRRDGWDLGAAVSNYDRALSICSDNVDAMTGKAKALFDMNDADGAISLLEQATKLAPYDYRPPYELGKFFLSCDDLSNALDRLLIALDRNENMPAVHDTLAELYDHIEDQRSATMHRTIAIRLRSKKKQ